MNNYWHQYLAWSVLTGMLAGLAIATHSLVALPAELAAAYCMFLYRRIAIKLGGGM